MPLPPAMFSVVTGDPREIADEMLTNEHVDVVTFTGSADTAARLRVHPNIVKQFALKLTHDSTSTTFSVASASFDTAKRCCGDSF